MYGKIKDVKSCCTYGAEEHYTAL